MSDLQRRRREMEQLLKECHAVELPGHERLIDMVRATLDAMPN